MVYHNSFTTNEIVNSEQLEKAKFDMSVGQPPANDLLLMMKDEVVLRVNMNEDKFIVENEKLLPYLLKNSLQELSEIKEGMSKYDITQHIVKSRKNASAFISFLASRVLPLSRENAKKIYNLFGFSQLQDDISKARIAIVCRAISLQDNYWLKIDKTDEQWKDISIRDNSLSEAVAQVSLHGTSLTVTGLPRTPELTGQGAYAKAWLREGGDLYLHKLGAHGNTEARIEVMVSDLLDKCNVDHLRYEEGASNGVYTCKCKCMTTDDITILPGLDFTTYCNRSGIDPFQEALRIDEESIYKMWIVDYLIANRDRHGLNWGFFCNCNTNEILGCHPLYDHNNSFDIEFMKTPDAPYLYDNRMTMRQAAKIAMNRVDFHFTEEITREDFITDRQYTCFTERASELGIQVKEIPR